MFLFALIAAAACIAFGFVIGRITSPTAESVREAQRDFEAAYADLHEAQDVTVASGVRLARAREIGGQLADAELAEAEARLADANARRDAAQQLQTALTSN